MPLPGSLDAVTEPKTDALECGPRPWPTRGPTRDPRRLLFHWGAALLKEPSAALSQLGKTWPVTARVVGLVIGADSSQAHVAAMLEAMRAADVVVLVVAPAGGKYGNVTAQRTYANASSTEFDALVVIGATPPAPDAVPALDTKSGAGHGPAAQSDPRVVKLLQEAWRHAKAIGSVDDGTAPAAADIPSAGVGIATGNGKDVAQQILDLLSAHRSWDRFEPAPRA